MNTQYLSSTLVTFLEANPVLERLFFASIELALLGLAVWALIGVARIRAPRARAILWLIVLAKPVITLAVGPAMPVFQVTPAPQDAEPAAVTASVSSRGLTVYLDPAPPAPSHTAPAGLTPAPAITERPYAPRPDHVRTAPAARAGIDWTAWLPSAILGLWLTGVAVLLLSTALDRFRLRRFLARTKPVPEDVRAVAARTAIERGVAKLPALRVSSELESPAIVGWFRPAIVVPSWLAGAENETALAWALRHEFTHLKHRDSVANFVRRIAQILFYYHPVTWWASRHWEASVELACDRAVVQTDDDVTAYAEQLYTMLVQARKQRQHAMATGLFATRTQINTRIAALLGTSMRAPARLGIAAVVALVGFAGMAFAVGGAFVAGAAKEDEAPATTINAGLQAQCESLLEGQTGAIVVLNAENGNVLAMAGRADREGDVITPDSPENPALASTVPPGALMKVVLAAAALEEGVIDADSLSTCTGGFKIDGEGRSWRCWKQSGHGALTVADALAYSCDAFFYPVALELGVDRIQHWTDKFGLGRLTGVDLPGEVPGLIPGPEWKKAQLSEKPAWDQTWFPGDTVNLSLGRGDVSATPLQQAAMLTALVNNGRMVTPRFNRDTIARRSGRLLSDSTLHTLRTGLTMAVEKTDYPRGTGWRAAVDGVTVLGKTASAQVANLSHAETYEAEGDIPYEMRDHAWFIAGADTSPPITVAILVKHGRHGSTAASVLARPIVKYVLESQRAPEVTLTAAHKSSSALDGYPPLPARTLTFPEDRSMGAVWIGDRHAYDYTPDNEPNMTEAGGWEKLGEAKGAVKIPAGKMVWLDVLPKKTEDVDLAPLADLPPDGVQYLDLYNMEIGDDDLRHIAGLSGLEALSVYRTNVTDAGLKHLAGLANLRWLDLGITDIEARDFEPLTHLKKLVHLDMNYVKLHETPDDPIDDALKSPPELSGPTRRPVEQLAQLTSLRWLNLKATGATDDDLKALAPLTKLETLTLESCPISNAGLVHLAAFRNLRFLSLQRTDIAEGYKTHLAALPQLDEADIDYTAVPDAPNQLLALGGRVVDEAGAPIPGAHLQFYGDYPERVSMSGDDATTDHEGRWAIRIAEGWTRLAVNLTHDGYISDRVLGIRPVPPKEQLLEGTATFVMKEGTRFSGTVRDVDGNPIGGALVMNGNLHGDFEEMKEDPNSVLTDDSGQFTMANLEARRHDELTVVTEEHAPVVVPLDYGAPEKRLAVTLASGKSIQGVVTDAAGEPLADATVSIREWRPDRQHGLPREATTDADGRFSLDHMPDHGQLSLSARLGGYHGASLRPVLPASDPLTFKLVRDVNFEGRVVDAKTGQPVTGYEIELGTLKGSGEYWWLSRYTDANINETTGTFSAEPHASFSGDSNFGFVARIRAVGYRVTESKPLPPDRLGEEVTIALEPAPAVTGTVHDAEGDPVADATVAWVREDQHAFLSNGVINTDFVHSPTWIEHTEKDGTFAFAADAKPGVLVAYHEKGLAWLDLEGHAGPADLSLQPWVRIDGTVHHATGELIPIAYKIDPPTVAGRADLFRFVGATVNTDETGAFVLDNVPPMPVTVGLQRRWEPSHGVHLDPNPGDRLRVDIADGPHAATGTFDFSAIADRVDGGLDVITDDRHLMARATPEGQSDDDTAHYIPSIEADGAFSIEGMRPGSYTLAVTAHATPPQNACGRGTPVGRAEVSFTVDGSGERANAALGTVRIDPVSFPQQNAAAPPITGTDLNADEPWNLASESGKLVVLDFWASWCAPCVAAMPVLKDAYAALPREQVSFVGLNLDAEKDRAKSLLEEKELPWKQVHIGAWADDNPVTAAYGVSFIPSLWIIDGSGKVLARDVEPDALARTVRELLP